MNRNKKLGIGLGVFAALAIAAQINEAAQPETGTPIAAVPAYTADWTPAPNGGGQYDAYTDSTDPADLNAITRDLFTKLPGEDGGYWVLIHCAKDKGTDQAKNLPSTAMSKIAVGARGAAQTGLPDGESEIRITGNTCEAK